MLASPSAPAYADLAYPRLEGERETDAGETSSSFDGSAMAHALAEPSAPPMEGEEGEGEGQPHHQAMSDLDRLAYLRSKAEHAERRERAEAAAAAANPFLREEQRAKEVRMVAHTVVKGDDLTDLAVAFGTTEASIRAANRRLVFPVLDNVIGEVINIPATEGWPNQEEGAETNAASSAKKVEADKRNAEFFAKRAFIEKTKASEAEAGYYLEESAWSLAAALAAFNDDAEWEESQKPKNESRVNIKLKAQHKKSLLQPLVFAQEGKDRSSTGGEQLRQRQVRL